MQWVSFNGISFIILSFLPEKMRENATLYMYKNPKKFLLFQKVILFGQWLMQLMANFVSH